MNKKKKITNINRNSFHSIFVPTMERDRRSLLRQGEDVLHTRQRPDRKDIKMEWIKQVYEFPEHEQKQTDGRKRKWGYIKEVDNYLRIVVLEDNETVHNAFFDRNLKK